MADSETMVQEVRKARVVIFQHKVAANIESGLEEMFVGAGGGGADFGVQGP